MKRFNIPLVVGCSNTHKGWPRQGQAILKNLQITEFFSPNMVYVISLSSHPTDVELFSLFWPLCIQIVVCCYNDGGKLHDWQLSSAHTWVNRYLLETPKSPSVIPDATAQISSDVPTWQQLCGPVGGSGDSSSIFIYFRGSNCAWYREIHLLHYRIMIQRLNLFDCESIDIQFMRIQYIVYTIYMFYVI